MGERSAALRLGCAQCRVASGAMELGQVLEQSSRFSKSLLWDYNRRYYEGAGANAWHTGQLPSSSTCNPFIAQAYAHTVTA